MLRWPLPLLSVARWRNAPCAACDRGIAFVIGGWEDEEEMALADVQTFFVPSHGRLASAGSSSAARSEWTWPPPPHRFQRIGTSAWTSQPVRLPDLPEARCFAAATFDAAGHLWVVGGGNGMTRGADCLRSTVTIDPNAEVPIWQPFGGAPLLAPRCGLSLAADGNHHALYLCGGYSGGVTYQDTVEVLDMAAGSRSVVCTRVGKRVSVRACTHVGCVCLCVRTGSRGTCGRGCQCF